MAYLRTKKESPKIMQEQIIQGTRESRESGAFQLDLSDPQVPQTHPQDHKNGVGSKSEPKLDAKTKCTSSRTRQYIMSSFRRKKYVSEFAKIKALLPSTGRAK